MKRVICWLFAALALTIAVLRPSFAEPPFLPVATCNNGICTMAEKDYDQFRRFQLALMSSMGEMQAQQERLANALQAARQELVRHAFCEGHRS